MGQDRDDLSDLFSDSLAPDSRPASRAVPRRSLAGRARRRAGTAVMAAVAVAGGLLPLYGDPRVTPVTHPLWAHMLLRGLDLEEAAGSGARASEVFGALAWTESLSVAAAHYDIAQGVVVEGDRVRSTTGVGEVRFDLAVVRGGDYRIRCHIEGDPSVPVNAEVGPSSGGVLRGFEMRAVAGAPAWVDAGSLHLDPGAYSAAVLLPPGAALDQLEVAPPCLRPIQPPEGWRQRAIVSRDDLAITLLQALDAEHALPPADLPVEIRAADVQVEGDVMEVAADAAVPVIEDLRLEGGREGLRAMAFVEVPEPALYTVYAFSTPGDGLAFLADGCSKTVLCPQAGAALAWRPVLSRRFEAGGHNIDVTLGAGARIEGLRLERKRDDAADYVTALRSLGFDPGPPGPVTGAHAAEAIRFLRAQRADDPALRCGDLQFAPPPPAVAPPALVAGAPQVPPGGTNPIPPGTTAPAVPPSVPGVDPQPPASPTLPVGQ